MKYSLEEVKKIQPSLLLKLINRAKKFLKTNDVMKEMCSEYGVSTDILDLIPMRFADINVSARTQKGIILLNYKLLCDGDFFKDYGYLLHETDHWLKSCYGDRPTMGADDGDYLQNPDEQSGFQRQIQYLGDMFGDEEADNYTEHLLDYHDKDGKERKELKETLMERLDE